MKSNFLRLLAIIAFVACCIPSLQVTSVTAKPAAESELMAYCCNGRVVSITVQRGPNNKYRLFLSSGISNAGGCTVQQFIWSVVPNNGYTVTNYNNGFAIIDLNPANYMLGSTIQVCLSVQWVGCPPSPTYCVPFTI